MVTSPSRSSARLVRFDRACRRRQGVTLLGGVDEAGRGPLAGPVVAACVVLAPGTRLPGVDDSKTLNAAQREALAPLILERAAAWGIGWATAAEIDRINILRATHAAAGRALAGLARAPEFLLTDFLKLTGTPCALEAIVDGDARSQAIAAASVLAKVARDRIMTALDAEYPHYGFAGHKGYGTAAHRAALAAHGPCSLHRMTFGGVRTEPFFEAEPANPGRVRCASRADLRQNAAPLDIDWRGVLLAEPMALDARRFLPECEWMDER